jgi:hypothetical protein
MFPRASVKHVLGQIRQASGGTRQAGSGAVQAPAGFSLCRQVVSGSRFARIVALGSQDR